MTYFSHFLFDVRHVQIHYPQYAAFKRLHIVIVTMCAFMDNSMRTTMRDVLTVD